MKDMVSVIVPVYNAESFLKDTVNQVLKQTYTDWELILVDDCSKDSSRQIAEELSATDERILLLKKDRNEGAAMARNSGLDIAKGRYIAFLDADDIWHENRLEAEISYMRERNAGFVFSAYEFGDENAKGTGKIVHVPESLTYRKALSRTIIFTSTVLFDREKIPFELIRMPNVPSEDTATWWQVLRAGYTAYGLDRILAIYRRPAKSLSSNKLKAVSRIWNLYRVQEKLSVISSIYHLFLWAVRATLRRI